MAEQNDSERISELRREVEAGDPVTPVIERMSPIAKNVVMQLHDYVRERPITSMVACIVVGWILGRLIR